MRLSYVLILLVVSGCAANNVPRLPSAPRLSSAKPSLHVAEVALSEGVPTTALRVAQGLLDDHPNDPSILAVAGEAERQLGDSVASARTFAHALSVRPHDTSLLLGLGKAQSDTDPVRAEATFRRVLLTLPKSRQALTDLGVSLDLQGRHDDAQVMYAEAIATGGDTSAAQVDLGLSLALSGHPKEGLENLKRFGLGQNASPRTRQDVAAASVMAGESDYAQTLLKEDMGGEEMKAAIDGYDALK
jgi:Flp pilus assembly protein TadD